MKVLVYYVRPSGGNASPTMEALTKQAASELHGHYAGTFHDSEDIAVEFASRPGATALLQQASRGDCLVVPNLKHLGTTVPGIQRGLETLRDRGLGLRQELHEQGASPRQELETALRLAKFYLETRRRELEVRRQRRLAQNEWLRQQGLAAGHGQRRWGERRIWSGGRKGRRSILRREPSEVELAMLRYVWQRWRQGEKIQAIWRERKWRNAEGHPLSYTQLWRGVRWFDARIRAGVLPGFYGGEKTGGGSNGGPTGSGQ